MKTTVIITQTTSEKTDHGDDIHLVFHPPMDGCGFLMVVANMKTRDHRSILGLPHGDHDGRHDPHGRHHQPV